MFCMNCGTQLKDGAVFCTNCGRKAVRNLAAETGAKPNGNMARMFAGRINKKMIMGLATASVAIATTVGVAKLSDREINEDTNISDEQESGIKIEENTADAYEFEEGTNDESAADLYGDSAPVEAVENEGVYSITTDRLCNEILQGFFQNHLGCYVNYMLGNCNTEPVNISTMLEHTGVVGAFVPDTGMRVVSDYSDNLFYLKMEGSNLVNAVYNKKNVSYRCSVEAQEVNFVDTFRYYEGTDAKIAVVAKLTYYIDEQPVNFYNKYVAVQLKNSSSDPAEWLIEAAIFLPEDQYEKVRGQSFNGILEDEV